MAVSTTNAYSGPYLTNGLTTVFPFTFTAPSDAEVSVVLYDAAGGEVVTPAYSVTITQGGGGSVTFATAIGAGYSLYILLDPFFTQDISFEDGSAWLASPVNEGYDRSASRDQVLKRETDRGVKVPLGEAGPTLPRAVDRANKYLAYDPDGTPIMSSGTGADAGLRDDLGRDDKGLGASLVVLEQGGTVQQAVSWVTPQMFGAVADDSSLAQARLNRAAINAAIAYLYGLGGGVVRIPHGVYHVAAEATPVVYADSYIYLRGGVHIEGDGMAATRIVRASTYSLFGNSPTSATDYTANGTDFRVSKLTLDGDPTGQPTPANFCYFSNATGIVFEDVRFLNCPGLHSLDLNGVKDVSVVRCRFEGHDHDLSEDFGGSSYVPEPIQVAFLFSAAVPTPLPTIGVRVRYCYFGPSDTFPAPKTSVGNHTAFLGAIAEDIIVEGCTMEGLSSFGARPFCWRGVVFRGNTFRGTTHGVYVTSAADTYDADGVPTGTPQSNEDITIDNNVFIDVVGGPPIGLSNAGGSNASSYAKHKRVSIINNKIIDSEAQSAPAMFLAWADGLTVTGNKHTGTRGRGIQQRFCSNVLIGDNDFDEYTTEPYIINESGSGNESIWVGTGLSAGIVVRNNRMAGSAYYALNFSGALSDLIITGNRISGIGDPNPRPGILINSSIARAEIHGNILDGSNGGMTIGVDVRSGATDIIVGRNTVIGATSAPYAHAGTGVVNAGGAGTPEAAIIAPVGSTWTRSDGGTGTTLYVKETGTSSTGWVAK